MHKYYKLPLTFQQLEWLHERDNLPKTPEDLEECLLFRICLPDFQLFNNLNGFMKGTIYQKYLRI